MYKSIIDHYSSHFHTIHVSVFVYENLDDDRNMNICKKIIPVAVRSPVQYTPRPCLAYIYACAPARESPLRISVP